MKFIVITDYNDHVLTVEDTQENRCKLLDYLEDVGCLVDEDSVLEDFIERSSGNVLNLIDTENLDAFPENNPFWGA